MQKKILLLPLILGATLVSCEIVDSSSTNDNTSSNISINESNHEIYAFEAATSIGLLPSLSTPETLMSLNVYSETSIKDLKAYLPSVEAMLLEDEGLTRSVVLESDNPLYETKVQVTYKDITFTDKSFYMYYNETIKQDDDFDEDERESRIEGVILIDDNEYKMWGEKEIEDDELETSFSYLLDEDTYVLVEQEKENDEQEFSYKMIKNGRQVNSYSLEMEDNEVELKTQGEGWGRYKVSFDLYQRDGEIYIRCFLNENGTRNSYLFKKVIDGETGLIDYQLVA